MKTLVILLCIFTGACKKDDDKNIIPKNTSDSELVLDATKTFEAKLTPDPINSITDYNPFEGFVKYTIPKGSQNCTQSGLKAVSEDSMVFVVLFDSTALYTTQNRENQGDINKLYGFSDCSSLHHTNSARFGWRYHKNGLELFAYTYANGVRSFASMGSIGLNQQYTCTIVAKNNEYVFYLNQQNPTIMKRGCNSGLQFRLYPYFGGDESAPHEVNIWIKDVR